MASSEEQTNTLGDYAAEHGAVSLLSLQSRDDPLSVLDEEDPIFAMKIRSGIDHIPTTTKSSVETTRSKPLLGDSNRRSTVARKAPFFWVRPGKTLSSLGTSVVKSKNEARAMTFALAMQSSTVPNAVRRSRRSFISSKSLNDSDKTGVEIPQSGIATGAYYDRLWTVIDELYDAVIVVLTKSTVSHLLMIPKMSSRGSGMIANPDGSNPGW